jgi:hypothetical protein
MLKHDQVTLSRLKTHELLQLGAECVQHALSSDCGHFRSQNTHPAQAGNDTRTFGLRRELAFLLDTFDNGTIVIALECFLQDRRTHKDTYPSFAFAAPSIFWWISDHVKPDRNHSFSSVSSHPIWASAATKAGLPSYLKDPLTTVSASGIL